MNTNKKTMMVRPVLIVGMEGTVRRSISGATFPTSIDDIELLPNVEHQIMQYKELGYLVMMLGQDNRPSLGLKSIFDADVEMKHTLSLFKVMPFNDIFITYSNVNSNLPRFKVSSMCQLPMIGNLALFEKEAIKMNFIVDWGHSLLVGCTNLEKQTADNAGITFVETGVFLTSVIASGPDTPNPNLN